MSAAFNIKLSNGTGGWFYHVSQDNGDEAARQLATGSTPDQTQAWLEIQAAVAGRMAEVEAEEHPSMTAYGFSMYSKSGDLLAVSGFLGEHPEEVLEVVYPFIGKIYREHVKQITALMRVPKDGEAFPEGYAIVDNSAGDVPNTTRIQSIVIEAGEVLWQDNKYVWHETLDSVFVLTASGV